MPCYSVAFHVCYHLPGQNEFNGEVTIFRVDKKTPRLLHVFNDDKG